MPVRPSSLSKRTARPPTALAHASPTACGDARSAGSSRAEANAYMPRTSGLNQAKPTSPAEPCGRPADRRFTVLKSTTSKRRCRIRAQLTPGSAVTTIKNTVDHVVTEYGIARLGGQPIAERARRLIAIAHPEHRDQLERDARYAGLLH